MAKESDGSKGSEVGEADHSSVNGWAVALACSFGVVAAVFIVLFAVGVGLDRTPCSCTDDDSSTDG